jgi:Bacterial PH domain
MATSATESVRDGQTPAATRPGLNQPVAGVVPPALAEAKIRTTWPTVVAASPALAGLGKALIRSIILAPLGWLLMAPLYFVKILPFLARRYTLTNRRLMVQRGLQARPRQQVALADMDDVRIAEGTQDSFYRSANLEVLSQGKVVLELRGVPDPEGFRVSVLNALVAWVPGKASIFPMIPASAPSPAAPAPAAK